MRPLPNSLQAEQAARFARLALDCVTREYPNQIAHVLHSDADVRPPRLLTPAFYGCYDWHSAVHGHWLLAAVARMFPHETFAAKARAALKQNITPANIAAEVRYVSGEDRATFERPYGLVWLLTLGAELRLFDPGLARVLVPLECLAVERVSDWLPKLPYADRSGQHANTAFALGLALDWARGVGDREFEGLICERARYFFANDLHAPCAFEPSGEDFLSPSLAEADLMGRVLSRAAFSRWLTGFFSGGIVFQPLVSPDPSDGKLAHLDGLNLSRAWMLERIARALPPRDGRIAECISLARLHAETGLAAATGEHYAGGHWLGTFAVYLLTRR